MKIGIFQFPGSSNITENYKHIVRAVTEAAKNKVRLLVFQECAVCGYPPVETPEIKNIDFELLNSVIKEIQLLAKENDMYIALGTIRKELSKYYNSLLLINSDGDIIGDYDKRILWGWDLDNFTKGNKQGVYQIDDIKVGFRICYEVKFPESFRELFKSGVELCFVSFCDVLENDSIERYNIIKSALVTRALENTMNVISVNSISKYQTAPTTVIDFNGIIIDEAPRNQEYLMVYDYKSPIINFKTKGQIQNSLELLGIAREI
ncbi:carbon-nitrogen hydrolase family protein [Sedimentibacter sp.]|uniref:carbon-nitrogen hydrolase family protein n=1 Tax=Sedimentibacter sp. TaxID=1960295 RepID=UPI00289AF5D4|nr:carbon-nitrogen hydrolase family protein [Sedimentibacter sp.]